MLAKSAFASKINWTQVVAFAGMLATVFGLEIPEEQKLALVATIQGAQSVLTWVLRTWFTHKPIA